MAAEKVGEASDKEISKMGAVRLALEELGKKAMPARIQEHIKEKYNVVMSTAHISNYKTTLLRKKTKSAKKSVDQAAKDETAAPTRGRPPMSSKSAGITLSDIRVVKGLVDRVGQANLKSLIEVLGE